MGHKEPAPSGEQDKQVVVISRRSFFGALLGVGTTAMGAMLIVPVLRFVLYPLYAKNKQSMWSKIGLVDELPPVGSPPVRKEVTFRQRDGWREVVTTESVYVERKADGTCRVLSSICPHLGCSVSWQQGRNEFFCPCHGSVFSRDGKRLAGPTPRGMDPLSTKEEKGDLLVHYEFFRPDVPNREELS
ncbi:MAG: QcrA and Rieske domain-containing protein [Acidobacteriaceae bacterium]